MANTKITTNVIADGAITSAKLDTNITISGDITGTLATAAQPNITSLGTLTALTGGTGDLNWDSGTLFVDSSANKVGIGITPTEGKLHIKSDGSGEVELLTLENSTGTNGKTTLTFKTTSTDSTKSAQIFAERVNASGHTDLAFRTYNGSTTERMRIDSSGKVGVACIDPQAYFEIDPAAADTAIFSIRRQDHATIPLFKIVQDSSVSQGTGHCHITSSNRDMSITAGENLDKTKGLYIKTTGNVGIGTTSPDTKLSIHEAINTPAIEIVPTADDNNADTAVLRLWGTRFGTANRYSEIRNVTDGSTANNELAFNTNGSERMRIDSGGDLTVGTSSAGFHFDVSTQLLSTTFGTGGNLTLACSNSSGAGLGSEIFLGGSTRGDVNRNSILFKNGASATQYSIDRYGTLMSAAVDSSFAHNTYAHAAVFTRNSTPHGTVVIEDSDVSSGIGNTVLKCYLRDQDPATLANFINFSDGGGTVGSITHNDDGGGVSFNTTSDYRLKENVDYDWDALTLVNQLRPAKFNFISNSAQTVQGFLAHEVSDIVPSSVRGDKDHMMEIGTITDSDGNVVQEEVYEHFCKEGQTWTQTGTEPLYQQLDYARLVPLLTKAIQEQQTIIDDLKSRIETLEG